MAQRFLGNKAILTASVLYFLQLLLLPQIASSTISSSSSPAQTNNIEEKFNSKLSWQEFLWEQQDHSRHKKNADSVKNDEASVGNNTKDDESTNKKSTSASNPLPMNLGGSKVKGDGDDAIVMEYVCFAEPNPCPTLKTYHMYPKEPEEAFYPSWSYFGFSPPSEWHNVPIKYFEEPPLKIADEQENYDIRKHGSAMHLCTAENTDNNVEKCKSLVRNECLNSMPSPINILTREAVEDGQLREFDFINYNVFFGFEMFFETDGTQLLFAKVLPRGKVKPGIRGGPLAPDNELFLDRIIFRVGNDYRKGSEHSLNGIFYGMEIQFFFTSDNLPYWQVLSRYKLFPENDSRIGQQVHVISLFVNVTALDEEKPPDGSSFAGNSMEVISLAAEMFWESENVNSTSLVRVAKKVFTLEDFFSEPTLGRYFTYQGSLSHPPCLTHVGWTVFETPIWITHAQWKRFIYVHAEFSDYRYLSGNFRPQTRIQVKADIEMFRNMKNVEGYGGLRQTELNEAAENPRLPIIVRGNISSGDSNETLEPLYLIRNYVHFQKYFARKVRKSKKHGGANSRDLYQDDYSDADGKHGSGATRHHYYYKHFRTLVLCVAVSWWMTMKLHK